MNDELIEWLKDRLDRMQDKLDKVEDHCFNIDKTIAANTTDIARHIRRTDGLQSMVDQFRTHLTRLHGAAWLIGFIGTAGGAAKYFGLL